MKSKKEEERKEEEEEGREEQKVWISIGFYGLFWILV